MAIVLKTIDLNTHYHNILISYMNEMIFKNIKGEKLTQREVCKLIIMDFLDLIEQEKQALEEQVNNLEVEGESNHLTHPHPTKTPSTHYQNE